MDDDKRERGDEDGDRLKHVDDGFRLDECLGSLPAETRLGKFNEAEDGTDLVKEGRSTLNANGQWLTGDDTRESSPR